jgi:hypothetical protein
MADLVELTRIDGNIASSAQRWIAFPSAMSLSGVPGAMGVDVIDLLRRNAGHRASGVHGDQRGITFRMRLGEVMHVGGGTVAGDFGDHRALHVLLAESMRIPPPRIPHLRRGPGHHDRARHRNGRGMPDGTEGLEGIESGENQLAKRIVATGKHTIRAGRISRGGRPGRWRSLRRRRRWKRCGCGRQCLTTPPSRASGAGPDRTRLFPVVCSVFPRRKWRRDSNPRRSAWPPPKCPRSSASFRRKVPLGPSPLVRRSTPCGCRGPSAEGSRFREGKPARPCPLAVSKHRTKSQRKTPCVPREVPSCFRKRPSRAAKPCPRPSPPRGGDETGKGGCVTRPRWIRDS